MRGNEKYKDLTPIKAIRAYCLDCMCGSSNEVDLCTKDGEHGDLCPLYRYRKGKGTRRKPELTEEQRAAMAERLRIARSKAGAH